MKADIYQVGNRHQYVAVEEGKVPPSNIEGLHKVKTISTDEGGVIGVDVQKLVEDIRASGHHAWRIEVKIAEG